MSTDVSVDPSAERVYNDLMNCYHGYPRYHLYGSFRGYPRRINIIACCLRVNYTFSMQKNIHFTRALPICISLGTMQ